jgi:zinc protease
MTLARHDTDAIAKYWHRHYPIGRAVLAIAGDVDFPRLVDALDETLNQEPHHAGGRLPSWPGAGPKPPKRSTHRVIERPDRDQGHVVLGFPGLTLGDPRVAALDVLMAVLGGQSGRLFMRLRERQGLVYHVTGAASEGIDGGHVFFYLAAAGQRLDEATAALHEEIAELARDGLAPGELERAKALQIGQFEMGIQRRGRIASRIAFGEIHDLGPTHYLRYPERVRKVRAGQLVALARELLVDAPRTQVTVRPR